MSKIRYCNVNDEKQSVYPYTAGSVQELMCQFYDQLNKNTEVTDEVLEWVKQGRGIPGPVGPRGEKGEQGDRGPEGSPGAKGIPGQKGDKGDPGTPGPKGDQGNPGPQGEHGPAGPAGATGPAGAQGQRGEPGQRGPAGEKGPKGDKGDTGAGIHIQGKLTTPRDLATKVGDPIGYAYIIGTSIWIKVHEDGSPGDNYGFDEMEHVQGPKGDRGETGPQGPKGDHGDHGDVGPAGPIGPMGPPGPQGRPGGLTPEDFKKVFKSTYYEYDGQAGVIGDADAFLKDGVAMTGKVTTGLPETINEGHQQGTIMFIRESEHGTAGTQMYIPTDDLYKGKLFIRVLDSTKPEKGKWTEVGSFKVDNYIQHANNFTEVGYRRTDLNTEGLPSQLDPSGKTGVLFFLTNHYEDKFARDNGIQFFYSIAGSTYSGNIYTRVRLSGIWEEWKEIIQSDDVYKKSDWNAGETTSADPFIHEDGWVTFPVSVGPGKLAMEWKKVQLLERDQMYQTVFTKVQKVYSLQVTQVLNQRTDEYAKIKSYINFDDHTDRTVELKTDLGNTWAYVTVIGPASGQ